MKNSDLVIKGKYNFKHQQERLEFVGFTMDCRDQFWGQFKKVGDDDQEIWAELLESDLWMIEETKEGKL
jgi:hypothetical protein